MKQLLFLLLFPCLAMAQYPGNAGQKLTLGEQTTADGLVYRGLAADTTRKPSVDTMAYILLDTNTNIIWQYKLATNNAWTRVGGSISSGLTGVLPVANGGTNTSTAFTQGSVVFAGASGTYSQDASNLFWNNSTKRLGIGTNNPVNTLELKGGNGGTFKLNNSGERYVQFLFERNSQSNSGGDMLLDSTGFFKFRTLASYPFIIATSLSAGSPIDRLVVNNDGEVWVGYGTDGSRGTFRLQVNGQIYATNATIATSDEKFKENIIPLSKGLEIVDKLKPVTFNFIPDTENNFSEYEEVGFIAQDVDRALSTETFAKSIVKAADDSEPTSTMGLATQNLIPILVKAIQEQQSLIKALEQRILILENK